MKTRAYVNAVLRNYWIYQIEEKGSSTALNALAQGMWSRFPDGGKDLAIRMTPTGKAFRSD